MTDKQIQQNAEAYAELLTAGNKEHYRTIYTSAKEGYIAGAHSRDEEIEERKESKRKLRLRLMQQIHNLRNPWISVMERLPGKARGLYELEEDEQHKHVLFRTRNGLLFSGYLDAEEIWRDERSIPVDYITPSPVTHWMHIPELKGGKV